MIRLYSLNDPLTGEPRYIGQTAKPLNHRFNRPPLPCPEDDMIRLSPDGQYYVRMAQGQTVPSPYSRRYGLPTLLGADPRHWRVCTIISLLLTIPAAYMFFGTFDLTLTQRIYATLLLVILPGVWRVSLWFPILLDAPGFLLTLLTATMTRIHPVIGIPFALLLGTVKESGPVFAALYAWNPIPLIGLLTPGWFSKSAPPDQPWLSHPIKAAMDLRRKMGPDPTLYLKPFGAALIGFVSPTPQLVATALVTALQLVMAQDTIRLTVALAPILAFQASKVTPEPWMLLGLLITMFLPDRRA